MKFRGFVAFALIALFGAGCTSGGDTAPSSAPSPTLASTTAVSTPASTTAAPSPSVATTGPNVKPGEQPPALSDVAKTNTRYGAREFAIYWLDSMDWAYATTTSKYLASLYSSACVDCARVVNIFDRAIARGNHFIGGRTRLVSARLNDADQRHSNTTAIDAVISADRLRVVSSTGRVVEDDPAVSNIAYRIWAYWTADHWVVVDYKRVVSR